MSERRVGLVEACLDRELFGFDLWPRQRELLEAVDRGPRVHIWALGRRSGKTTLAALVCLHAALLRPDLDERVRRGERRYAVGVATNLSQARLLVNAARSILERSPLLAPLMVGATEDELTFELPSGARTALRAFPCSSRGGRGWPISTLVLDEFAHHISDETEGYQTAARVWEALVPATAQFGDAARILAASTPFGREGVFAELFQRASSGELPDAVAQQLPTADVNPEIDEAFLERERLRDPEGFAQEYEANFASGGAAFLDLSRATIAERAELPPERIRGAVAGLDPAFSSDPFGLAIVGRPLEAEQSHRMILAAAHAWRPPKRKSASFEERRAIEDEVLDGVAAVCKRYAVQRVVTDQYAARAVVDRLKRHGLFVRVESMTAASKTAVFGELRARTYSQDLELYDHPDLLAELGRLRSRFTAGSASVVNPRVGGSHGDLAQALALAVAEQARIGAPSYGRRRRRERQPGPFAGGHGDEASPGSSEVAPKGEPLPGGAWPQRGLRTREF